MAVRKMNFHKIKMKRFQMGIGSVSMGVCCVCAAVWCVVCGVWCVVCGVWCVCAVSKFFENCHHDDHTRLPQTISDLNIIWYKIPDLLSEYQHPIRMVLFALSVPTVVEIRYFIASTEDIHLPKIDTISRLVILISADIIVLFSLLSCS
jgi:hypothetical protein